MLHQISMDTTIHRGLMEQGAAPPRLAVAEATSVGSRRSPPAPPPPRSVGVCHLPPPPPMLLPPPAGICHLPSHHQHCRPEIVPPSLRRHQSFMLLYKENPLHLPEDPSGQNNTAFSIFHIFLFLCNKATFNISNVSTCTLPVYFLKS